MEHVICGHGIKTIDFLQAYLFKFINIPIFPLLKLSTLNKITRSVKSIPKINRVLTSVSLNNVVNPVYVTEV